jgi:type IV pilus assembly protein PilW
MRLVELMVGMLIGLIGIVIITHLYLTNEQYKRSTTGSGTAQINGAVALYSLERDVRMAGVGLNHSGALGCSCVGAGCSPVPYYFNGTYSFPPGPAAGALQPLVFAPVVITDTAGVPDSVTVLFGNAPERGMPGALQEPAPPAQLALKVDGTAGFAINDYVVLTQGNTCALARLTNVVAASSNLERAATSQWNPNLGTSTFPSFGGGAFVFNLGNATWRTYSIGSNRLQATEVLGVPGGGAAVPFVDDIVDLQAEYGRDANNDGAIAATEWTATTPVNATEWQQVIAIRVGLLARSGNYEKPSTAGGPCEATLATPTWAGSIDPVTSLPKPGSVFTIPGGIPSCYKYRVFETTIPLRNMIWRPA